MQMSTASGEAVSWTGENETDWDIGIFFPLESVSYDRIWMRVLTADQTHFGSYTTGNSLYTHVPKQHEEALIAN